MNEHEPVKCVVCGRFVSYVDMECGGHFRFEPDSDKGPEVNEWTCAKCHERERKQ